MALNHTARAGSEVTIGSTRLVVLDARHGVARLSIVEAGQQRTVQLRATDTHALGKGSVRLHWARRGEARLGLSAPAHIPIQFPHHRSAS